MVTDVLTLPQSREGKTFLFLLSFSTRLPFGLAQCGGT
jgi:hypothetical protein